MSSPDLRATSLPVVPATVSRTAALPTWAFAALVALGFALKLLFLGSIGTQDQEVAIDWGRAALDHGLVAAFNPSGYPLTFHIYEALVWFCDQTGLDPFVGMKLLNLAADTGCLIILIALLHRLGVAREWALLYWLFPYFLAMGWLGFDHFIMGFLVLLALWFVARSNGPAGLLPAAFLMGLLFVQRPQVMVLVLMLVLFIAAVAIMRLIEDRRLVGALWNERTRAPWAMLVGAAALFAFYSLWFYRGGREITFLADTYRGLSDWSPGLSANMLNVWAMVAEGYRTPGQELYAATGPDILYTVALLISGAILVVVAAVIARRGPKTPWLALLSLFAMASIVMPNSYVHAHENHFYLGALLGIPIVAALRNRALVAAFVAYLALQAFNLFGLYGFGHTGASDALVDLGWRFWFTGRFIGAALSTILFIVIVVLMLPRLHTLRDTTDQQALAVR
jgi:hypothetical protein